MAKIATCIWLLCFIILSPGFAQQNHLKSNCLKQTYESQIGVLEATGNNDGYQVEQYLQSAGFGSGYAWCASFVNWVLIQCCLNTPKSPAWSPVWFPASKVIYSRDKQNNLSPSTSNVFGIYFANLKRIAHVGFIDSWNTGDWTVTVEGNTNLAGSREGDGVYRKKRLKRQIYQVSDWTK